MLHGLPDATVTCFLFVGGSPFNMFTLDRPTCVRSRLSVFQFVQGFSAPPGRCSSALMLRCNLASRGSSRFLHSSNRAAFAVIGLYRDVWIAAIASSTTSLATRTAAICVRFQGRRVRRVYVTMQITFLTRTSALIYRRGLRQRVASLTLNCNGDFAIRAYVDGLSACK